jgi:hypothetical protein
MESIGRSSFIFEKNHSYLKVGYLHLPHSLAVQSLENRLSQTYHPDVHPAKTDSLLSTTYQHH